LPARKSAGAWLSVAVAAANFLLPGPTLLVHVFVPLDLVAGVFELLDIRWFGNRVDAVTLCFGVANAVIEDLDLVFADQVQHSASVFAGDRNAIAWH
jgi:hypothetical protein